MSHVPNTARRDTVVGYLNRVLNVRPDLAVRLLVEAKAECGPSLAHLARHVAAYPQALTSVQVTAAPAVIRLSVLLHNAGFTEVVVPFCSACGQVRYRLEPRPSGLLCPTCAKKANVATCSRCGNLRPIHVKADGVCRTCWRHDPAHHRPCAQCGTDALASTSTTDGGWLCARCYSAPEHTCVRCGKPGQAFTNDEDGPVCASCYRYPKRLCSRCGKVRRVNRRERAEDLDLCAPCVASAAAEDCAVCCQRRPVVTRWSAGGVCRRCYDYRRMHPDTCGGCGETATLIGTSTDGKPRCGPCSSDAREFTCVGCGRIGEIYARHRCTRCVLSQRLTSALARSDGIVSAQLSPLIDAMLDSDQHHPMLRWLSRTEGAKLLTQLVRSDTAVSHDALDAMGQTRAAHHLRDMLTSAGVLPVRADEHLIRAERFVDVQVESLPTAQAHIIRQFSQWFLLRRARWRAQRKPTTLGGQARLRAQVRATIALLRWLESENLTLAGLTQPDLERWIDQHPAQQLSIDNFIRWTSNRKLTTGLRTPKRRNGEPSQLLDSDGHLQQLQLCLDHDHAPIDVRVAGAFVLLFGIPLAAVLQMTSEDFVHETGDTYLIVGNHRLLLPPRLASMINQLEQRAPGRSSTLARLGTPQRWLFPSTKASRPTTPSWMTTRLREHGITVFRGRNAARMSLAADVPAAILASQTGIHIDTAVAWSKLTARDWLEYVAARP